MRILGIDPGLHHTGWGVIDAQGSALKYVACGTISSNPKDTLDRRLLDLTQGIQRILENFTPDQVAMEETFLNKNPKSSAKLWQARGALIATIAASGKPFTEYAATLVKKSVTGVGRAEKGQMLMMVNHLLPQAACANEDAGDALGVAICHFQHYAYAQQAGVRH